MSVTLISKLLTLFFVSSVVLWYLYTPYIVKPHPKLEEDIMSKVKLSGHAAPSKDTIQVENWTKWKIFVNSSWSDEQQVVYGHSVGNIKFKSEATMYMEWRSDYIIHVSRASPDAPLSTKLTAPSYSDAGIYRHFTLKTDDQTRPSTLQVVPRFLFGLRDDVTESLYGQDVNDFPVVGVFSDSNAYDRVIIQFYMNLVTMSVVFLLWAHNSPKAIEAAIGKKKEH